VFFFGLFLLPLRPCSVLLKIRIVMTRRPSTRDHREESIRQTLQVLTQGGVEFIVVGGICARMLGLDHPVNDLDIVYRRSYDNCRKLAETLRPFNPYPRGLPPGMAVPWNTSVIRSGYSFLIQTDLGELDLIAELSGGLTFQRIRRRTFCAKVFGIACQCLELDLMIYHIELSGRPKDLRLARRLSALRDAPGKSPRVFEKKL